ncbi:MAG: hypothetical protein ACT4R6_08365 [Gemmatimonadaceae bacterium]
MTSIAMSNSHVTTPPAASPPVQWADDETLRAVRPEVRSLLEQSPAFNHMKPAEQRDLARLMVKVCAYMANPDGLAAQELSDRGGLLAPNGRPVARAAADDSPMGQVVRNVDELATAGDRFQAAAVKAGVQQFGALVKKVDFPKFVSGLIQNVFQAIVDSSIQQMRAYGELLANVAKTVDQFAQDNITANNARDWLAGRFPDTFEIGTSETSGSFAEDAAAPAATANVTVKETAPDNWQEIVSQNLELKQKISDISDPNEELRIVTAARLQIARSRQQLLSSMVVLGINRIVVTDGLIHAKVVFDMRASDLVKRAAKASSFDQTTSKAYTEFEGGYSSWFSPWSANVKAGASTEHVATVESSVDDTSESKAEVKAKLTGEVRVNFKSDYFPMEKLASPQMIAAIQGNAIPPEKPTSGA